MNNIIKKNKLRIKINLFFLFIFILLVSGCYSNNLNLDTETNIQEINNFEKEEIKIGVILPLSGDFSFFGKGIRNSLELANEDFESSKYEFKFIYEDDGFDPKRSVTAAQKLINVDEVDVLISLFSSSGNVISPVAQSSEVIHFSVGTSDSNVAKGNYNFIHWTRPQEENRVFVNELNKRGIKKIAIFALNQQGVLSSLEDLRKRFKLSGIEIVSENIFDSGEKDFRSKLLKAKNTNPDIYLLLTFSPELEIIAKQMNELNIEKPITSIESFEYSSDKNLFEGEWYVHAANVKNDFNQKYENRFGIVASPASANAYDSFFLIAKAYDENGKNNSLVSLYLENMGEFNGVFGNSKIISGGIIDTQAVLKEIKNGESLVVG